MYAGNKVLCRIPGEGSGEDIEDLVWLFFLESFESMNGVWIVSPWVSAFNFKRDLVYLPYVFTKNTVEILKKLAEHTEVHVLTRCFDDFVSLDTLYVLYKAYVGDERLPKDVASYFYARVAESMRRLESLEEIVRTGVSVKTDIERGVSSGRILPRLHAKLYVNDKIAIVGSANFTYMGISRTGNWECAIMVTNGDLLYTKIRDYTIKLFEKGRTFSKCVSSVINDVNNTLGQFNIKLNDLYDLKRLFNEIQEYLKKYTL